jgi:A/G-specific adenine glycosylase
MPGRRADKAVAQTPPTLPIAPRLVAWQRIHGRHDLPWQQTRDPYRVWLSEVMLQQTQVSTVLGYYEKFLQRFPTVTALAAAPLDDVLALWSGLGYYSRARNLHACAQAVMDVHRGTFPSNAAALATLPGIGRSTAAAIAAFCFGEPVAILDGNVKRVLTRWLGFDRDIAVAANEKALWHLAQAQVPERDVEAYTQGLMDLGATVCVQRAPQCAACPLNADCRARQLGEPERFPVKTRKLKRSQRSNVLLWVQHRDSVWLVQRPGKGVWAGLWTLPLFDDLDEVIALTADWPGGSAVLAPFSHALTHFDWALQPVRHALPARALLPPIEQTLQDLLGTAGQWHRLDQLSNVGLPAPIRRLLG